MTITDLYPLCQEAIQALDPQYRPAMNQALADAGLEGRMWGLLLFAQGVEPLPLTPERLQIISPYTTVAANQTRLSEAAAPGWLAPARDGGYRLTERGRAALLRSFGAVHQALAEFEPLPTGDLRRLADLLRRIVEASLAAPTPADKLHLHSSRRTDPGEDAPIVARIDQYLTDLIGFRDDVHPAAWQTYEVSGPAWEALTLIWRGEADTPAALSEKLAAARRLTPADYAEALQSLAARGWAAEHAGAYEITDAGRALRQQVEDETDRLFYEPWRYLGDGEEHELRSLLTRLRDRARELSAAKST